MTKSDPFAYARDIKAPNVEKRPVEITQHGITRVDNYAWLRDENWQEVLRDSSKLDDDIKLTLDAETAYYKAVMDDLSDLRKNLFDEIVDASKKMIARSPLRMAIGHTGHDM